MPNKQLRRFKKKWEGLGLPSSEFTFLYPFLKSLEDPEDFIRNREVFRSVALRILDRFPKKEVYDRLLFLYRIFFSGFHRRRLSGPSDVEPLSLVRYSGRLFYVERNFLGTLFCKPLGDFSEECRYPCLLQEGVWILGGSFELEDGYLVVSSVSLLDFQERRRYPRKVLGVKTYVNGNEAFLYDYSEEGLGIFVEYPSSFGFGKVLEVRLGKCEWKGKVRRVWLYDNSFYFLGIEKL